MSMDTLYLKDDQFPFTYINEDRIVCRAILINENNEIALNKLHGFDAFGSRDYYETPGGGKKDNETIEEACLRELEEETGYKGIIIEEIMIVDDYYNLIHRHNINHYFLCKTSTFVDKKLENYEKTMIEKLEWMDIDKAIETFSNMNISKVSILVKNRELPVLIKVKNMMEKL